MIMYLSKRVPPEALSEVDVPGGGPPLHNWRHYKVIAQSKLVMDREGGLVAGIQPPHWPRNWR